MTNDKQIEAWQAEFESLYVDHGMTAAIFHKKPSGLGYLDFHTDCLWTGFLIAKRSMPVIELQKPIVLTLLALGDTVPLLTKDDVIDAITAAGYSYRVKE